MIILNFYFAGVYHTGLVQALSCVIAGTILLNGTLCFTAW